MSWKSAECVKYFIYTFTSLHIINRCCHVSFVHAKTNTRENQKIHDDSRITVHMAFIAFSIAICFKIVACTSVCICIVVIVCVCWANHLFMHSICNCVFYLYLLPRNVVTSRALLPHSFTRDMDVLGMLALVVINTLICSRCEFVTHNAVNTHFDLFLLRTHTKTAHMWFQIDVWRWKGANGKYIEG